MAAVRHDPDLSEAHRRAPWWSAPVVGVPALAAGLAVAQLVGAVGSADVSPLVAVGDRVVDRTPKWLRDWAIDTFGTADKAVLLVCVTVVLAAVATVAGGWMVAGRERSAEVLVGVTVLLGALSSLGTTDGWWPVVATLLGGVVALLLLRWLGGMARPVAGEPVDRPPAEVVGPPTAIPAAGLRRPGDGASRRRFLASAAGVGLGAAVVGGAAGWLRSRAALTAERLGIALPRPVAPLAAASPEVEVGVDGVARFFTPNDSFYRIDTALAVPRVDPRDWSLRVHGRVAEEMVLGYEALLDRPMIELDATIACVSNEVGGDLVGTARWLGCRLDDLLADAGVDPAADQVVGRSVDGFTAGFPVAALDGREAIVAVGMNEEPLPFDHGFPARLVVPGLYGYVSATKWLAEIELTRFEDFEAYWIPRGWDREAPILTMSRIDSPRDGAAVPAGGRLAVGGVAWAPNRGIEAVEVQLDDEPWEGARLGAAHADTTWRQWAAVLEPVAGSHVVRVRATDGDGTTQTSDEVPPGPNAATGWHTIGFTVG